MAVTWWRHHLAETQCIASSSSLSINGKLSHRHRLQNRNIKAAANDIM